MAGGGGVKDETTDPIEPDDDWLNPEQAGTRFTKARDVRIEPADGVLLKHKVTLRLNGQSLQADWLRVGTVGRQPRVTLGDESSGPGAVTFLAELEHRLSRAQDDNRAVTWNSLDHVSLTTPAMMQADAERLAFAPRYKSGWFRGEDTSVPHAEIAPLRLAGAGWFDGTICESLWKQHVDNGIGDAPVLIGSSVTLFPIPELGTPLNPFSRETPTLSTMVPSPSRRSSSSAGPPILNVRGTSEPLKAISLPDHRSGAATRQVLAGGARSLSIQSAANQGTLDTLHVEQSFVDCPKVDCPDGAAPELAPPFLRATLALYLRWRVEVEKGDGELPKGTRWAVATVHASRDGGVMLATLIDTEAPATAAADEQQKDQLPVDLVVLSRRRIT